MGLHNHPAIDKAFAHSTVQSIGDQILRLRGSTGCAQDFNTTALPLLNALIRQR
jgi:hypothetical protein